MQIIVLQLLAPSAPQSEEHVSLPILFTARLLTVLPRMKYRLGTFPLLLAVMTWTQCDGSPMPPSTRSSTSGEGTTRPPDLQDKASHIETITEAFHRRMTQAGIHAEMPVEEIVRTSRELIQHTAHPGSAGRLASSYLRRILPADVFVAYRKKMKTLNNKPYKARHRRGEAVPRASSREISTSSTLDSPSIPFDECEQASEDRNGRPTIATMRIRPNPRRYD
jgi:hypothetical protein